MISWTGLAPWEFDFFFQVALHHLPSYKVMIRGGPVHPGPALSGVVRLHDEAFLVGACHEVKLVKLRTMVFEAKSPLTTLAVTRLQHAWLTAAAFPTSAETRCGLVVIRGGPVHPLANADLRAQGSQTLRQSPGCSQEW